MVSGQLVLKAGPYHNLALDEAHECIINKNLKSMTTRPSHFRMVQLADFMSYLDKVMTAFEEFSCKWHKQKEYEKKLDTSRSCVTFELVNSVNLFSVDSSNVRLLSNVFMDKPLVLDCSNVSDLISISTVGQDCMMSYIRQYILTPPTELRQKRKCQKLKTSKASSSKLRSQANHTALLLASAYKC